jgi:hypothetical protein
MRDHSGVLAVAEEVGKVVAGGAAGNHFDCDCVEINLLPAEGMDGIG